MADKSKYTTVESYMAALPAKNRKILETVRKAIQEMAPEAEEVISYQLPAFKYHGMLIYYSVYKEHVSLAFPSPTVFTAFKKELEPYETGKSTIKFPIDAPMPLKLMKAIVKHRMKENIEKEKSKGKK